MKNILLLLCGLMLAGVTNAETRITHLQVEYTETPIGIDVRTPRFGWQMEASAGQRDLSQTYYQLEVRDPKGVAVWNSGKISSGVSAGVSYGGSALQPATRYSWTVKVWSNTGTMASATSWFETGLMNSGIGAWEGASWIGGGEEDLVLYSNYLALFVIKCDLSIAKGSSHASVIFAANDPRLMERYKNIFQLELGKDQSYFKVELDISAVDGTDSGRAKLRFFRVGYTPSDNAQAPVKTFDIPTGVINKDNKYASHQLVIKDQHGDLSVSVDGGKEVEYNLNPVGPWGDYIGFGMLCDMGFSVDKGQHASFSHVSVSNVRSPARVLFQEDLSGSVYDGIYNAFVRDDHSGFHVADKAYVLDGADKGVFVTADPSRHSMPMLRTKFTTGEKKITGARLYVTARGIYEIYLNGRRVGDDYYNPGLTQYNITHLYQTYDVTGLVNNGDNALGAMLGEGWWSGLLSYGSVWNHFGDRQSLLARLVISYDDGTRQVITSNDGSWKYFGNGPVIYSSLDMGEVYDATREALVKNWSTAGYDDSRWTRAKTVPLEGTADRKDLDFGRLSLIGQIGRNAGIFKVLTAQKVKQVAKGIYIYNMGQNFTGVPRIHIVNGRAGQKLTIRVAEMLYPDLPESGKNVGLMMTENYRAALSQDMYVMRDGEQVWQPHFTSHGYQYIEISGMDEALPLEAVQGVAISSVRAVTSGYETSNEKVNKLWSNLVWSNVDNFLTIPTDCPQRNERMGWSGDISVFSRTATYVSNADQFLRRHMFAMRDVQSPAGRFTDIAPVGGGFGGLLWGSAGITVPWEAYLQYNDTALLREHYPAMVRYINYLDSSIDRQTGLCKDRTLGDWLGPQNSQLGNDFLVTAYHVYDLDILYHVAQLLGNKADARRFEEMHRERKAFFNKTFVGPDKKAMGFVNDTLRVADVETAYAVGLALNIFDSVNIPYMSDNLKRVVARANTGDDGVQRPPYSLMTGFIGTAWINKALSDHGGIDAGYKLLQNDQFPSWLYSVDQGATTIWERLNGYTTDKGFGGNNGMNSFNHYSFGAIGQWMIAYSLGIQRGLPGFKQFVLQPEPDPTGKMTWAKGYYDSPYGRISSSWKIEKGQLLYEATVPANTTAVLYLPVRDVKSIRESGHPIAESAGVRLVRYQGGAAVLELHSGSYAFRATLSAQTPVVSTRQGFIKGVNENGIAVFKGIPYAQPPVGGLRYQPPVSHQPWRDTLNAVEFASAASQPSGEGASGSEDCLYLNLYTPATDNRKRPVVIWVHGGSMTGGSGKGRNGQAFADKDDIVAITINYRLGALGFLYLGDLGPKYRQTGNLGLLDVIAALQWVHDNIAAFGGDPGRVTVMGESAGAKLLSAVMVSPASKGLYQQAILESGAVQCIRDSGTAKRARGLLMKELGLGPEEASKLLTLPAEKLIKAQAKVCDGIGGNSFFGPVYDGVTIPEDGYQYAREGKLSGIRAIIGTNENEGATFIWKPDIGKDPNPRILQPLFRSNAPMANAYYKKQLKTDSPYAALVRTMTQYMYQMHSYRFAQALTGAGTPVYLYRYRYQNGSEFGAHHGDELHYIWDAAHIAASNDDETKKELARNLHGAWVAFIKTGDPNGDHLLPWPAYKDTDRQVMVFDTVEAVTRLNEVYDDKQFPSAVFVIK